MNLTVNQVKDLINSNDQNKIKRIEKASYKALDVLDSAEYVHIWMITPARGLGYKKPIEVAGNNEKGLEEVINLLGCIEYGVYV